MKYLGMCAGAATPAPDAHVGKSVEVPSPVGGVLRNMVDLGDEVAVGQVIAIVTDLVGENTVSVHAEREGVVIAVRQYLSTSPGDLLFRIFRKVGSA